MTALEKLINGREGLKGCPFCDGAPNTESLLNGQYHWVHCPEYDEHEMQLECNVYPDLREIFDTAEEAAAAWNTRPREDKLAEVCKVLLEALEWMSLPHEISTKTKEQSDYWAHQFKLAKQRASNAIGLANEIAGKGGESVL